MIRIATKEDLPEIAQLWKQMVNELKPDWKPDVEGWINIELSLFDTDNHVIVIAVINFEIVGFLEGVAFYDPAISKQRGFGQSFYVIPKYRNTNIAVVLLNEILVQSLMRDAESLELFCLPEKEEYWNNRGFVKELSIMRMVIS